MKYFRMIWSITTGTYDKEREASRLNGEATFAQDPEITPCKDGNLNLEICRIPEIVARVAMVPSE
ncbi:hypothetical protein J1614_012191 [Plenodomus biglobosus]|nr:hypothetical protein J1614_012191 [Plenodomus biglobosus]